MVYEASAFIYGGVMDETLCQQWLAFSKRRLQESTKNILELVYDTRTLAVVLAKDGYGVTGLDLSEEMLMIANQRTYGEDASIQFVEGNMLDLSETGQYRTITCFSNSLCYMKDRQEVQQVLDRVYQALEENGRFLFDVHSTCQADGIFPEYSYHYQGDNFAFLWGSYPGGKEHSIEHFLTSFVEKPEGSGRFIHKDELHEERIYPLENYSGVLKGSEFLKVETSSDFTNEVASEKSERWFFVACKD